MGYDSLKEKVKLDIMLATEISKSFHAWTCSTTKVRNIILGNDTTWKVYIDLNMHVNWINIFRLNRGNK